MKFNLLSNSFNDGDYLSTKHCLSSEFGFGCDGNNISPELHWFGIPDSTKSLAITCYDPDAPTGSGFWHWLIVNIPPTVNSIEEGVSKLPHGALETRTDFGKPGYGGPCPPEGSHPHRYIFTIFCLSVDSIPVEPDTSAAVVGFMVNANKIQESTIMGLFKR